MTAPTTLLYSSFAVRMYVAHSGLPHCCSASLSPGSWCRAARLLESCLGGIHGCTPKLTNPLVTTVTGAVDIADAIAPAYLNWSAV